MPQTSEEFTEQDFSPSSGAQEFSEADFAPQIPVGLPRTIGEFKAAATRPVVPPDEFARMQQPFVSIPRIPQEVMRSLPNFPVVPGQPSLAAVAGLIQSGIKGVETLESPLGVAAVAAPAIAPALRVPLALSFAAAGAKGAGEAAGELAGTPNLSEAERFEKLGDILQSGAMMLPGPAVGPLLGRRIRAPFENLQRLEQERKAYATEREITPPGGLPAVERQPLVRQTESETEAGTAQRRGAGEEAPERPRDAEKGQARVLLGEPENPLQRIYRESTEKFEAVKKAIEQLFPGIKVTRAPENVDIRISSDGQTLEVSHTLLDDIQKMYPDNEREALSAAVNEERLHHSQIKQLGSDFKSKLSDLWVKAGKDIQSLVRKVYGQANLTADEWGAELLRMGSQSRTGRLTESIHPRRGQAARDSIGQLRDWAEAQTGEIGDILKRDQLPQQIAEQVGGWKYEGEEDVGGKKTHRFTGTERGAASTIHVPIDATPEEIAQRLSATRSTFVTASEVLRREPGTTPPEDIMQMNPRDIMSLGAAKGPKGESAFRFQADSVIWGSKQPRSVLPKLEKMLSDAEAEAKDAREEHTAAMLEGRGTEETGPMMTGTEGKAIWLRGAIEGVKREGRNYSDAVKAGLVKPQKETLVSAAIKHGDTFTKGHAHDPIRRGLISSGDISKLEGAADPENEGFAVRDEQGNERWINRAEGAKLFEQQTGKKPETEGSLRSEDAKAAGLWTDKTDFTKPPASELVTKQFSNFTETGPGGETRLEMHGTPSGLPPGVPPGPPTMPAELLEASRRLGTLIRTRATLRPGVLGQYVRALAGTKAIDKIEVGDLNNQLTMSHEMGHDLDQLLWPQVNLARTVKSLEARAGSFGTAKELHGELIPVSELIRGPISGSRGHIAYRRSASELIADFFALYAHDPDRARAMAPKFSKAFEAALARNPDAEETIRQLHAGNVTPIAPETTVSPTGKPAKMPGKIQVGQQAVSVSRDASLAVSAENLVKGTVREFDAQVQRARIIADRWRKDVPKQQDRNDVGAFVEGIGNLEVPGDTRQAVISRMTPAKQQLVKIYRHAVENLRGKINEFLKGVEQGEYLAFLENFLPHLYANSKTAAGREAVARFIKNSPNARQRKIPTLQEAVEYGLTPITQDPAVLYENYAKVNWRVATNRKLVGALKDMRTSAGQPVITPWGQAPAGYVRSDNPLIQRVYAAQTPKGTLLWRGGAGIHPDAWRAVRMILEDPTSNTFWRAFDALNSITRANAFAFSLFHDVTLRAAALGSMAESRNPFRGIARVLERNPITGDLEIFRSTRGLGKELLEDEKVVADAAQHGLKFSWTESESYEHGARDALDKLAANARSVPVIGQAARLARDVQHMRMQGLWRNTHDAFKIIAYNDLTAKALSNAPPETNPAIVKERVASLLNDSFGGQEWQTKFWLSPQVRRTLARFFLAPDWTLSTIRSVPLASDIASTVHSQLPRIAGREPIPTAKEGIQGNLGRTRFWAGEMAALAMATVAAQYAIYQKFGDPNKGDKPWVWDNEYGQKLRIDATPIMRQLPWHDPNDPTRQYVNLGKRPQEIVGWFIHPDQNLYSKMSRPAAELIRQVAGTEGQFPAEWKRDHETFLESLPARLKSVAGEFAPFTFQGNQFALSLPYRKGMTKFKAQQAYESTYELAADPDRFTRAKAFLRGVPNPKGTLEEMVGEITDAAERNGVPAEEVRKRALSVVRGKYYSQFFRAYEKGDFPNMDKAAEALERLGATPTGEQESLRRREALQPISP